MKVGIGLPNAVADVTGEQLTGFARRAEAQGFSSLGTIDRIVYGNWAPLVALAAAATVTERIGLMTTVMLGPLRLNPVQTAKQALTVNQLSGGRLTLGIGLGARGDDYEISGSRTRTRGEVRDDARRGRADVRRRADRPAQRRRPADPDRRACRCLLPARRPLRRGLDSRRRAARPVRGDGRGARKAWADAGNDGEPRLAALAYFALGDDAEQHAQRYLTDYYAFLGEETAQMIAGSAATDADTVKGYLAAFEAAGCGELIMFPCSGDPAQADLLGEAVS